MLSDSYRWLQMGADDFRCYQMIRPHLTYMNVYGICCSGIAHVLVSQVTPRYHTCSLINNYKTPLKNIVYCCFCPVYFWSL